MNDEKQTAMARGADRNGWPAVVWDPGPADINTDSTSDAPSQALWLDPAPSLSATQLRELRDILGLHEMSLLEVKKRFADGQPHLLVTEHPNYVGEIAERLCGQNISFRIEQDKEKLPA